MKMARVIQWFFVALVAVCVVGGVYWYANQSRSAAPAVADASIAAPVVRVKVEPLREESLEERLTTYGTVVAALGKTQAVSEPFETRVRQIFVAAGESVDADAALIEIEPSPDTRLQLEQAQSELSAAQEAERLARESLAMKLTTRQDLNAAEQRLQNAQLALESMTERGIGAARTIRASAAGVVTKINAEPGQIVAAGSPLLELIGKNQINVRLGIEDEDVKNLSTGQRVRLVPIHDGQERATDGTIELITQQVNPQTRLIDVYVAPASTARLMLNEYVRGEVIEVVEQALVAPRSAVLPEEEHYVVYAVEQDHVVKHQVRIGIENDKQAQILDSDLQAGQLVVVTGNSELADGMAVTLESAP